MYDLLPPPRRWQSFILSPKSAGSICCRCPLPGSVQGQVGWGLEQPGPVEGVPAHGGGVGTGWSKKSLPTPIILWFGTFIQVKRCQCTNDVFKNPWVWRLRTLAEKSKSSAQSTTGLPDLPVFSAGWALLLQVCSCFLCRSCCCCCHTVPVNKAPEKNYGK